MFSGFNNAPDGSNQPHIPNNTVRNAFAARKKRGKLTKRSQFFYRRSRGFYNAPKRSNPPHIPNTTMRNANACAVGNQQGFNNAPEGSNQPHIPNNTVGNTNAGPLGMKKSKIGRTRFFSRKNFFRKKPGFNKVPKRNNEPHVPNNTVGNANSSVGENQQGKAVKTSNFSFMQTNKTWTSKGASKRFKIIPKLNLNFQIPEFKNMAVEEYLSVFNFPKIINGYFHCNICDCKAIHFRKDFKKHIGGLEHKKKVIDIISRANVPFAFDLNVPDTSSKLVMCKLCNRYLKANDWNFHINGKDHRKMLNGPLDLRIKFEFLHSNEEIIALETIKSTVESICDNDSFAWKYRNPHKSPLPFNFNIPDRYRGTYYCRLCECHMNTQVAWKAHLVESRHIQGAQMKCTGIPRHVKFFKSNQGSLITETIKKLYFPGCPIIGLNYILEFRRLNPTLTVYSCFLCGISFHWSMFLSHVITPLHRHKCIKRFDAVADELIVKLYAEGKNVNNIIYEKACIFATKYQQGTIQVMIEEGAKSLPKRKENAHNKPFDFDLNIPDKSKGLFNCRLCNCVLNNLTNWEEHVYSKVHLVNLNGSYESTPKLEFTHSEEEIIILEILSDIAESANSNESSIIKNNGQAKLQPPVNFNIPDRFNGTYYCRFCECHLNTSIAWKAHIKTTRHNEGVPKNFIGFPHYIKFSTSKRKPLIIEKLKTVDSLIIGLNYITEFRCFDLIETKYVCFLCCKSFSWSKIIDHIISMEHKLAYIKRIDPLMDDKVSMFRANGFIVNGIIIERITALQFKYGQGEIKVNLEIMDRNFDDWPYRPPPPVNFNVPNKSNGSFYCRLCERDFKDEDDWVDHLISLTHDKNLGKNFFAESPKLNFCEIDLDPLPPDKREKLTMPLVGLNHITRYKSINPDSVTYVCYLCHVSFTPSDLDSHLQSVKHYHMYIKTFDPECEDMIISLDLKDISKNIIIERVLMLEKKYRQGKIKVMIEMTDKDYAKRERMELEDIETWGVEQRIIRRIEQETDYAKRERMELEDMEKSKWEFEKKIIRKMEQDADYVKRERNELEDEKSKWEIERRIIRGKEQGLDYVKRERKELENVEKLKWEVEKKITRQKEQEFQQHKGKVPYKEHTSRKEVPYKDHTSRKEVPYKDHTSRKEVPYKEHNSRKEVPYKEHSRKEVLNKEHTSRKEVSYKDYTSKKEVSYKEHTSRKEVSYKEHTLRKETPDKDHTSRKEMPNKEHTSKNRKNSPYRKRYGSPDRSYLPEFDSSRFRSRSPSNVSRNSSSYSSMSRKHYRSLRDSKSPTTNNKASVYPSYSNSRDTMETYSSYSNAYDSGTAALPQLNAYCSVPSSLPQSDTYSTTSTCTSYSYPYNTTSTYTSYPDPYNATSTHTSYSGPYNTATTYASYSDPYNTVSTSYSNPYNVTSTLYSNPYASASYVPQNPQSVSYPNPSSNLSMPYANPYGIANTSCNYGVDPVPVSSANKSYAATVTTVSSNAMYSTTSASIKPSHTVTSESQLQTGFQNTSGNIMVSSNVISGTNIGTVEPLYLKHQHSHEINASQPLSIPFFESIKQEESLPNTKVLEAMAFLNRVYSAQSVFDKVDAISSSYEKFFVLEAVTRNFVPNELDIIKLLDLITQLNRKILQFSITNMSRDAQLNLTYKLMMKNISKSNSIKEMDSPLDHASFESKMTKSNKTLDHASFESKMTKSNKTLDHASYKSKMTMSNRTLDSRDPLDREIKFSSFEKTFNQDLKTKKKPDSFINDSDLVHLRDNLMHKSSYLTNLNSERKTIKDSVDATEELWSRNFFKSSSSSSSSSIVTISLSSSDSEDSKIPSQEKIKTDQHSYFTEEKCSSTNKKNIEMKSSGRQYRNHGSLDYIKSTSHRKFSTEKSEHFKSSSSKDSTDNAYFYAKKSERHNSSVSGRSRSREYPDPKKLQRYSSRDFQESRSSRFSDSKKSRDRKYFESRKSHK